MNREETGDSGILKKGNERTVGCFPWELEEALHATSCSVVGLVMFEFMEKDARTGRRLVE